MRIVLLLILMSVHLNDAFITNLKSFRIQRSLHLSTASKKTDISTFSIPKADIPLYTAMASLQVLPPLAILDLPEPLDSIRKPIGYLFFITTACLAVYSGAKRQDIKQMPSVVSKKQAFTAPIVSSAFLFGLYLLLKYTNVEIYFDKLYQLSGAFLGLNCIDIIVTSVIGEPFSAEQLAKDEETPLNEKGPVGSDNGLLLGGLIALSYLVISNFGGGSPEALCSLSFFNNVIALSVALFSIGTIRVESFAVACALLTGLFFYDIFWVFGTDVMMTVATKVEAPVKFLFPAAPAEMAIRKYPFSVLGLGDIVVPGIMAGLARKFDMEGLPGEIPEATSVPVPPEKVGRIASLLTFSRKPESETPVEANKTVKETSYLNSAIVGYGGGLLLAFAANEITKAGQPALLYLVPCIISSMFYAAYKNDEVSLLWGKGFGIQSKEE